MWKAGAPGGAESRASRVIRVDVVVVRVRVKELCRKLELKKTKVVL
jgi:hypothetical protein